MCASWQPNGAATRSNVFFRVGIQLAKRYNVHPAWLKMSSGRSGIQILMEARLRATKP